MAWGREENGRASRDRKSWGTGDAPTLHQLQLVEITDAVQGFVRNRGWRVGGDKLFNPLPQKDLLFSQPTGWIWGSRPIHHNAAPGPAGLENVCAGRRCVCECERCACAGLLECVYGSIMEYKWWLSLYLPRGCTLPSTCLQVTIQTRGSTLPLPRGRKGARGEDELPTSDTFRLETRGDLKERTWQIAASLSTLFFTVMCRRSLARFCSLSLCYAITLCLPPNCAIQRRSFLKRTKWMGLLNCLMGGCRCWWESQETADRLDVRWNHRLKYIIYFYYNKPSVVNFEGVKLCRWCWKYSWWNQLLAIRV